MKTIISHAGIFDTKDTSVESIKKCVTNDIGIEIDLRLKKDSVYVSHDVCQPSLFFDDVCSCLVNTKIQKALHIKELDAITPTLETLAKYKINNFFLFTVENHKFQQNHNVELAYYANTYPQKMTNKIIWCDESIKKWFNQDSISKLKNNHNQLIAISQEILTNCSLDKTKSYWTLLCELGFDGICTNYVKECKSFLKKLGEEI